MAPLRSIIVSKPHVPFSQRLIDPRLRCLTVAQLRKKARENGLDVSRLTEKWEFVHVLVRLHTQGAQAHLEHVVDTKRHSIFDLPGEIRNKIYGYVLVDENPIFARYEPTSPDLMFGAHWLNHMRGCSHLRVPVHPNTTPQLLNMSWTNRAMRMEVRSLFFFNNRFVVLGEKGSSHINFLDDIDADGRANITVLDLSGSAFYMYTLGFIPALSACKKLRDLTIRMHVQHIIFRDCLTETRESVKIKSNSWAKDGCKLNLGWTLNMFTLLPALSVLKMKIEIPDWNPTMWIQYPFHIPSPERRLMADKVCEAVSSALGEMLSNVDIEVSAILP
jgi:hypothetical protein